MATIRRINVSQVEGRDLGSIEKDSYPRGTLALYEEYNYNQGRNIWKLRLPDGGLISEGVITDNPTIELTPYDPDTSSQKLVIKGGAADDYHLHLTTGDLGETSILLGTDDHNVRTVTDGTIKINSYDYGTESRNEWSFDNIGQIYFPDGTIQYTAWAGGRVKLFAPASSKGTEGDRLRDIAFDSDYFYYCVENYTPNMFNTTVADPGLSFETIPVVKGTYGTPTTDWTVTFGEIEYSITNVEDGGNKWILTTPDQTNMTGGTGIEVSLFNGTELSDIWKRVAWSNDTW
jgi:hypothetical protein